MAADSPNQQAALDLVEYLTSAEQQLAFSEAFGPMPSVQSAGDAMDRATTPTWPRSSTGADYATGCPPNAGSAEVIADFNSQLESLETGDPSRSSTRRRRNLEAVVGG